MPAIEMNVDLGYERLSGLDSGSVLDLIGMAQKEVQNQQKEIFGEGKV